MYSSWVLLDNSVLINHQLLLFLVTIPDSIEHTLLRNISTLYKVSFQMHFLAVTFMQTSAYFYTLIRNGNFKLPFSISKNRCKVTSSARYLENDVQNQCWLKSSNEVLWQPQSISFTDFDKSNLISGFLFVHFFAGSLRPAACSALSFQG